VTDTSKVCLPNVSVFHTREVSFDVTKTKHSWGVTFLDHPVYSTVK